MYIPGSSGCNNLQIYDAVGVVEGYRGAKIVAEMLNTRLLTAAFSTNCSKSGEGHVFLEI